MSDRYRVQVCTSSNQADEKLLRPSGNDGITRGAVFQTVHLLAAIEQLQPLNFINFEWPAPFPWRTCTLQEDDPPSSGEPTSPPCRYPPVRLPPLRTMLDAPKAPGRAGHRERKASILRFAETRQIRHDFGPLLADGLFCRRYIGHGVVVTVGHFVAQ